MEVVRLNINDVAVELSRDLRHVLEDNRDYLEEAGVPFFGMFPDNCCQGASVFLGVLLSHYQPRGATKVIHGSTRNRMYHHFWVEVNSKVYDLTIDQFYKNLGVKYSGIDEPIYGDDKHPLRKYFFYKEKMSAVVAFSIFVQKHANLREILPAYQFIRKKLEKMGWIFPSLE